MNCDKCDERLVIVQSYSAGGGGRTHVGECPKCQRRYTLVTIKTGEQERVRGKNGEGAKGLARALKSGEASVSLVKSSRQPKDPAR